MVRSVTATRMDRRRFLGASAAVLTGGCLDRAALTGSTPSPAVASAGGTPRDCDGGIAVRADPFDAGDVTIPLDDRRRTLVAEAVAEGAAEAVSYGEAPLGGDVFVRHEGAFYETDYSVTTTELPAYRLNASWTRGRRAPADATVVPFDRLPRADRRALTLAVHGGEGGRVGAGDDEGPTVPQASMSVRRFPVPYPNGGEDSRLVGAGVVWVSWEGRTYRVEVGGSTTTERRTRRYRVERVADDAAGFRRAIESEFAVRLTPLSRRERAIVGRAINADGGYEECTPASDALGRLRGRLPDGKRLPTPDAGSWYVRIGDEGYVLTVTRWEA